MGFGSQLLAFSKQTQKDIDTVYRTSSIELCSAIIVETPVKQGTLRGAWHADLNFPTVVNNAVSNSQTGTISKLKAELVNVNIRDVVFFSNNMPYAPRIEYDGYSGKAPQGMVRINTSRWKEIVSRNVRKLK
jgi:hypothetical protein